MEGDRHISLGREFRKLFLRMPPVLPQMAEATKAGPSRMTELH